MYFVWIVNREGRENIYSHLWIKETIHRGWSIFLSDVFMRFDMKQQNWMCVTFAY